MWRSAFKLGATHLRPMTEIALKSTYLCGNISPIQYDIRVGVRAIRMNIALDYSPVECFDWKRCVFQIKKKRFFSAWSRAKLARIPREMNEPIGRRVYYLCYAQHNIHWWREMITALHTTASLMFLLARKFFFHCEWRQGVINLKIGVESWLNP